MNYPKLLDILRERKFRVAFGFFAFIFLAFLVLLFPPNNFPVGEPIEIKSGESISSASRILSEKSVVRSELLFRLIVELVSPRAGVIAGEYVFDSPQSLFSVIAKMTDSFFGKKFIRVTIPEGLHNREISDILDAKLSDFDKEKFVTLATGHEGYLYPDTYYFDQHISEADVIRAMRKNFDGQIATVQDVIKASGKSEKDIVIMASIIEREARDMATRQMIAGILWKRIENGVLMQVDAPFVYILNKGSRQLTKKEILEDSPYNTYVRKGLPVGPIGNPSTQAILAAATPKSSKYWFYLADRQGKTHYAINYDQHLSNRTRYMQ